MLNSDWKYDEPRKVYCFNEEEMKEHDRQIRAEVIDEFANKIKEYSREHYLDCNGYGCQRELVFRTEDFLDEIVEQLKEQSNGK